MSDLVDRPGPRWRGMRGRLNSLSADHWSRSSIFEVVDVAAVHEPDERCLVAFHVGGDTEHAVLLDALGVLGRERLERPAARGLLGDGVGIEPGGGDGVAQHVFLLELLAVHVARLEQREVRVEELVGKVSRTAMPKSSDRTPVPHSSGSRSQTGGSPSSTCTWSSEKGTNRKSKSTDPPDRMKLMVARLPL